MAVNPGVRETIHDLEFNNGMRIEDTRSSATSNSSDTEDGKPFGELEHETKRMACTDSVSSDSNPIKCDEWDPERCEGDGLSTSSLDDTINQAQDLCCVCGGGSRHPSLQSPDNEQMTEPDAKEEPSQLKQRENQEYKQVHEINHHDHSSTSPLLTSVTGKEKQSTKSVPTVSKKEKSGALMILLLAVVYPILALLLALSMMQVERRVRQWYQSHQPKVVPEPFDHF